MDFSQSSQPVEESLSDINEIKTLLQHEVVNLTGQIKTNDPNYTKSYKIVLNLLCELGNIEMNVGNLRTTKIGKLMTKLEKELPGDLAKVAENINNEWKKVLHLYREKFKKKLSSKSHDEDPVVVKEELLSQDQCTMAAIPKHLNFSKLKNLPSLQPPKQCASKTAPALHRIQHAPTRISTEDDNLNSSTTQQTSEERRDHDVTTTDMFHNAEATINSNATKELAKSFTKTFIDEVKTCMDTSIHRIAIMENECCSIKQSMEEMKRKIDGYEANVAHFLSLISDTPDGYSNNLSTDTTLHYQNNPLGKRTGFVDAVSSMDAEFDRQNFSSSVDNTTSNNVAVKQSNCSNTPSVCANKQNFSSFLIKGNRGDSSEASVDETSEANFNKHKKSSSGNAVVENVLKKICILGNGERGKKASHGYSTENGKERTVNTEDCGSDIASLFLVDTINTNKDGPRNLKRGNSEPVDSTKKSKQSNITKLPREESLKQYVDTLRCQPNKSTEGKSRYGNTENDAECDLIDSLSDTSSKRAAIVKSRVSSQAKSAKEGVASLKNNIDADGFKIPTSVSQIPTLSQIVVTIGNNDASVVVKGVPIKQEEIEENLDDIDLEPFLSYSQAIDDMEDEIEEEQRDYLLENKQKNRRSWNNYCKNVEGVQYAPLVKTKGRMKAAHKHSVGKQGIHTLLNRRGDRSSNS